MIVLLQVEGAEPAPVPAAIIRLADSVDGKKLLTGLLKGLREEKHEGKTYYRSSTGEAILGLPLAGAIPDEHTVLLAPEPILRKMLPQHQDVRIKLYEVIITALVQVKISVPAPDDIELTAATH